MQRLTITGGTYTFAGEWIGHVLYGVPVWAGVGIARHIIGYEVHFPHAIGSSVIGSTNSKTVWFFKDMHCHLLDPLPYSEKPRFTLVSSFIRPDEKVWAKVVTSQPNCAGCSFHAVPCMGKTPPCSPTYRHKGDSVIFVTAVEKW